MKHLSHLNSDSFQLISSEVSGIEYLQKMNNVSKEINSLEANLKNAGIPFQFIYVFMTEKSGVGDVEIRRDHCLVWSRNKNNQFRLSYQIFVTEHEFSEDGEKDIWDIIQESPPRLKFERPLIETKGYFRLRIQKELSYFFDMIIDSLKKEASKKMIIVHSPNNAQYSQSESALASYLSMNERFCPFCSTGMLPLFCYCCQK